MTQNIFDLINQKKAALLGKRETIKPNPGNNFYVLLPSWRGEGQQFWKDSHKHWIKNAANEVKAVCACTMAEDGHCDICDAIVRAKQQYATDPAMLDMINQWGVTRRILFNVVELDFRQTAQGASFSPKNDCEVKVLEVPTSVGADIFTALSNTQMSGITNPFDLNNVYPINIVKSGSGKMGTKYQASMMMAAIHFAPADINNIMSGLKNLDEFVMEDPEAHGRALSNVSLSLGEVPAQIMAPSVTAAISAPKAEVQATVAPIVNNLSAVIEDSIPTFESPASNPAYTAQPVEQPQQSGVTEVSKEDLAKLLSSI